MRIDFSTFPEFSLSACSAGTVQIRHTVCGQDLGETGEHFQLNLLSVMGLIHTHHCPEKR